MQTNQLIFSKSETPKKVTKEKNFLSKKKVNMLIAIVDQFFVSEMVYFCLSVCFCKSEKWKK